MPITPFTIVNPDGSINQSEYERCINFLNDYIAGTVKVYPSVTWDNPVEIDMDREESATEILSRYILYSNNKLLTKKAFNDIKKLFTGMLERYGSTIHSYGRYIEQSKNFVDGPGYKYDVFTPDETEVKSHLLNKDILIYYLDDENHTVLEYNDIAYSNINNNNLPTANFPNNQLTYNFLQSNVDDYPNVYKGNLCGVYSDFQRLSGQYVGSSTLFYYSECNDVLYVTGGTNYRDTRVEEIINFNYDAEVSNKSKPTRGIALSNVSALQTKVIDGAKANGYIKPSEINTEVDYLTPTDLTAANEDEWLN